MSQNIIEYARELSVKNLFSTKSFRDTWQEWKPLINANFRSAAPTNQELLDLGDHLSDIFRATAEENKRTAAGDESQSNVSKSGTSWEAFICWYLNICLVGRRTFVLKHHKSLIPAPIHDAITVNYGNFPSNSESDLIAITFPNKSEYTIDKENININGTDGLPVPNTLRRKFQFLPIMNALTARDFNELEIHIIQCKTNWNDNAQIPMLWDAVYSASSFGDRRINIGVNGHSIHDVSRFSYSFVTVPSNHNDYLAGKYKNDSTSVLRVSNLTGGNYWGHCSQAGVASSIKEMLNRNLRSGHRGAILTTINSALPDLGTTYNYFDLL